MEDDDTSHREGRAEKMAKYKDMCDSTRLMEKSRLEIHLGVCRIALQEARGYPGPPRAR